MVIYLTLCEKCDSENVRTHTTARRAKKGSPGLRYLVCKDCGHNFKAMTIIKPKSNSYGIGSDV